jgi:hypothetical protein
MQGFELNVQKKSQRCLILYNFAPAKEFQIFKNIENSDGYNFGRLIAYPGNTIQYQR